MLEFRPQFEAGIVALLETPGQPAAVNAGIEREAASYARSALLRYEWEGSPDGPLAEAAFADEYRA